MNQVADLQTKLDDLGTRFVSDRAPHFIGKLDFSKHKHLKFKILEYKWTESVNVGYDIGLVSAVVGYFVDNPNELLKPEYSYLFESHGCEDSRGCLSHTETNLIQGLMMLIAFSRNRYYRSEEQKHNVGEEEANLDFLVNRSEDWARRTRNALCAICTQSPYCDLGQVYLRKFIEMTSEVSSRIYVPVTDIDWMQSVHGVDMRANDYH